MKKPIIGITANIQMVEQGSFLGYERAYVMNSYVKAVEQAGAVPLVLPVTADSNLGYEYAELIDGLLLTGGQDIHPLLFGEEPHEKYGSILPERDALEAILIKTMLKMKQPILGICRGMQMLNIVFGGTLYQDLSERNTTNLDHMQRSRPDVAHHTIEIKEESVLGKILGREAIVNSYHHQAIKRVAQGFNVTATAKDGVIEAIEMINHPFVVGVQFHPEVMTEKNDKMRKLFTTFVHYAAK